MASTIDGAGRVVIPQSLRRRLGLTAGTRLDIDELDGAVVLRPVAAVRVEAGDDGLPLLRASGDVEPMITSDVRQLIEEGQEWSTP